MRALVLPCRRLPAVPFFRSTPGSALRHSYRLLPQRTLSTAPNPRGFSRQQSWLGRNRLLCIGSVTVGFALPLGLASPKLGQASPPPRTMEQLMLDKSDQEREELSRPSGDRRPVVRVLQNIRVFLIDWIFEPIATGLRFTHLALMFLPVILAIPLAYIGPRRAERSCERTGTILWYALLIKTLERAGPTFVKVRYPCR